MLNSIFITFDDIIKAHESNWYLEKTYSFRIQKTFLEPMGEYSSHVLTYKFPRTFFYSFDSLIVAEEFVKSTKYKSDESLELAYILYLFFCKILMIEAVENDNKLHWVFLTSNHSVNYNYSTNHFGLTGFRGKYLGRDPNLFYLVDELIDQLTNGTYTNLLSTKFKELAPYTHKKAPKE